MSHADKIRKLLADSAHGMTVSEIAAAIKHDANKVSALLAWLRKSGRAHRVADRWVLTGEAPAAVNAPASEPEPDQVQDADEPPVRFWVYSDCTVGIAHGETSIELSQGQLAQLVEFLAGRAAPAGSGGCVNALQARLDDGEDSFSTPNERKSRERAEKRLRDAQVKASRALNASCDAVSELVYAFDDVHPGLIRDCEDGRRRLIENMAEFACYLDSLSSRGAA